MKAKRELPLSFEAAHWTWEIFSSMGIGPSLFDNVDIL